jgi:hypothetical protein
MKTTRPEGHRGLGGAATVAPQPLPDDDEVVEMANLSSARTGVDGVIFISTRKGSHGPRVKYFLRPGRSQPSFSVAIEDDPKVVANSLPEPVVSRMAPSVIEWVKLNRAALLDFWHHGDTWLDEQVTAFKEGLQRLPG